MPDLQRQINERVAAFVADVTEIARQAAMETLTEALHDGAEAKRRAPARENGKGANSGRRPRGGKRTPEELEQTAEELYAHIQANPGERMEEIAKAMGTTTRDLALPVKKLLADRRIRTEGQKRATRYYPGGGRGKARGGRKPARAAAKRRSGRKSK